jgi:fimbrial chaperone protein
MRTLIAAFALTATFLVFGCAAHASLRVNPLIIELSPDSQNTSSVVEITNVTDKDIPLEISVVQRTVVDSAEVDVPADDDFVIFPPQLILPAGETQVLRLQWLGTNVSGMSESFYVRVTQIPAELDPGKSGVRISYQFGISVHVTPRGVSADLQAVSLVPVAKDGVQGFELTVRNNGTKYARLSEHDIRIGSGLDLSREEVRETIGTGFLLPGQERVFFIPHEGEIPDDLTADLVYRGAL